MLCTLVQVFYRNTVCYISVDANGDTDHQKDSIKKTATVSCVCTCHVRGQCLHTGGGDEDQEIERVCNMCGKVST